MKLNKKEILKKVEKIEERKAFVKRCLKAKVCPDCGGKLKSTFLKCRCSNCSYMLFLT